MKKVILFLIIGLFSINLVYATETFTPIFCNDYEFTGCYEEVYLSQTKTLKNPNYFICPTTASRCEINGIKIDSGGAEALAYGSENCAMQEVWNNDYYSCDDEKLIAMEFDNIPPNYHIYIKQNQWKVDGTVSFSYTVYNPILKFSGTACGAGGSPVSGADGCKFNPKGNVIYLSDSMKDKLVTSSYTVPLTRPSPTCIMSWVSGNRHICGYMEESCNLDLDCGGHTYENKECTGRKLQTYGCRNYGIEPEHLSAITEGLLNLDGDASGYGDDIQQPVSGNADFGKRCEIINSEPVECCGDSDCGTSQFCDKSSFTCKEEVECTKDYDCGVSVQCDAYTNTLKKPICDKGKCSYDEEKVDCCSNENCLSGGYCDEYQCKESTPSQLSSDNAQGTSGITGNAVKKTGSSSSIIGIIIGILVLLGLGGAVYYFKSKASRDESVENVVSEKSGIFCENCGSQLTDDDKFCTGCGTKV